MKLYIAVLLLFISSFVSSAMEIQEIKVCRVKTTHIIFPSEIKYYSGVDGLILLKKASKYVLSVKAGEYDFDNTNITVATMDGEFYSFEATYEIANNMTYVIAKDKVIEERLMRVNQYNLSHIILPFTIKYIDYGNDWIRAEPIKDIQNIIKVEVVEETNSPTNISVIDEKDNFYSIHIMYDENASDFNLVIEDERKASSKAVILAETDLNDYSKEAILQRMNVAKSDIVDLGMQKNAIKFTIDNVFISGGKLAFKFTVENRSYVTYDIDYMKFYIIDRKHSKESASQEIECTPIFLNNYQESVKGKKKHTYVVCFDKFTIPDKKYFIIEINEKNGGRHIFYRINNETIENADKL